MRSARDYLAFVPLDWSQSEKIALLLSLICLRLVAAEAHDDQTLDAADSALAAEFQRGHMAYTKAGNEDPIDHRERLLAAGVSWQEYERCLPQEQPWMNAKSRRYWVHVYRLDQLDRERQKQQKQ
jgi:hypothetical protein